MSYWMQGALSVRCLRSRVFGGRLLYLEGLSSPLAADHTPAASGRLILMRRNTTRSRCRTPNGTACGLGLRQVAGTAKSCIKTFLVTQCLACLTRRTACDPLYIQRLNV